MRIVFMGTPEFAVPSLDLLVQSGYEIPAIVTATDKAGGRNKEKQIVSAVKTYANQNAIPVLQPERLKDPLFIEALRNIDADLFVVVAFRMLPEVIWNMPKHGTYNLHGSLLPKYRGAAPIHWAIIRGESETGVTSFKLRHEIDTGDLLFQEKMAIGPDETAGELHDRMKYLAAEVVYKTVKAVEQGRVDLMPQDPAQASSAPKIFPEDGDIDWNRTSLDIFNLIRGLSPYPTARTQWRGMLFKIFRARRIQDLHGRLPGTIDTDRKEYLRFAAIDGWIECLEVQMEGRKKMDIRQFLNGYGREL